jgi:transcriptional regulator NrdR family protein
MKCPECGGKTKVENTKSDEWHVYRQRRCIKCGFRFYTEESGFVSGKLLNTLVWQAKKRALLKKGG